MRLVQTAALAAAVFGAVPAWAHQVWLERDGTVVRAYFGEPAEDLREKTGGLLDRLSGPDVFTTDPRQPLPVVRKTDHLEIPVAAGTQDVRLVEASLKPFTRPGTAEATKTVMLAREGRQEIAGVMELEFVPATPGGDVFVLTLRGEPLPKVAVVVVGPPRWEKHLTTDAKGQVRFEMPWRGRYTAEAAYSEQKPGGSGEEAYTQRRLVSTISFERP